MTPQFQLPDFRRSAWVSDTARDAWKPRFAAIQDAWPRVAIEAVAGRKVECALRTLPSHMIFRVQAEAKRLGIAAVALGVRGVAVPSYASGVAIPRPGRPYLYYAAIGTPQACRELESLWSRNEFSAAYRLAACPECCVAAFQRDVDSRRIDPAGRYAGVGNCTEADGQAIVDSFWSWLNIEPSPCPPCNLYCTDAFSLRMAWISAAENCQYHREMEWLKDALSWPFEWSALHGIAEFRAPILKATWTTDATNQKATLRFRGQGYPPEGATGLHFPFRQSKTPPLTSSKAFERGIENLIRIR